MTLSLKERILPLADVKRAAFNARLAPSLDPKRFLGARTPDLKTIAKSLTSKEIAPLAATPNDENWEPDDVTFCFYYNVAREEL